jgi:protein-tyrosine phosphatase
MRRILDELDAALAGGETVYLHCWGGIGRTGTVVGCHLARHGMSGAAALREVMRLRRNALCGEMPSPETPEQRQLVMEWHA